MNNSFRRLRLDMTGRLHWPLTNRPHKIDESSIFAPKGALFIFRQVVKNNGDRMNTSKDINKTKKNMRGEQNLPPPFSVRVLSGGGRSFLTSPYCPTFPYVNYPYKVKNLTRRSLMTSQVRSKSEFSTFRAWWHRRVKFRNKRKQSQWIGMV